MLESVDGEYQEEDDNPIDKKEIKIERDTSSDTTEEWSLDP